MQTVFVYGFKGTYTGKSVYEYSAPTIGSVHRCMIFISQDSNDHQFESAIKEIGKYGFEEVENLAGNPLIIEALNKPRYQRFAGFYEEALETGSSLLFYPNT